MSVMAAVSQVASCPKWHPWVQGMGTKTQCLGCSYHLQVAITEVLREKDSVLGANAQLKCSGDRKLWFVTFKVKTCDTYLMFLPLSQSHLQLLHRGQISTRTLWTSCVFFYTKSFLHFHLTWDFYFLTMPFLMRRTNGLSASPNDFVLNDSFFYS